MPKKLQSPVSTQGSSDSSDESNENLKGKELRGKSFVKDYGRGKDTALMKRLPTMLKRGTSTLIPRPEEGTEEPLLVVFDLDETIVYARDGPLFLRPHAKRLLRTVGKLTEVALWTAGVRDYGKAVLAEIEKEIWGKSPAGIIKHLITRNKNWFDEEDYTKDLRQLGRSLDKVLIIENTPECVRLNPKNAIIVEDFEGAQDTNTLEVLENIIVDLVDSKTSVPKFIPRCKSLEAQHIEGQGKVFYLSAGRKGGKVVKENKDKPAKKASRSKAKRAASSSSDEDTVSEEVPVIKKKKTAEKKTKK